MPQRPRVHKRDASHSHPWCVIGTMLALSGVVGCANSVEAQDPALESLELHAVQPSVVVPNTALTLDGLSFVSDDWGISWLRLRGSFVGESRTEREVDVIAPASFVDFESLRTRVDEELLFEVMGSDMSGSFHGEASVEVESGVDGQLYQTKALPVALRFRRRLTPTLVSVSLGDVVFVNDRIEVSAEGLLLGGQEGTTMARFQGCFSPRDDSQCTPVESVDVAISPKTPFDRTRGSFLVEPQIAGISPGAFTGSISLRNVMSTDDTIDSSKHSVSFEMVEPTLHGLDEVAASLGQYVHVRGGGFAGQDGATTLLQFVGTFERRGASPVAVDLVLVPTFVDGRLVRYVMSESDSLGALVDLRRDTGVFAGEMTPEVSYRGHRVRGRSSQVTLAVAPVKQVIHLNYRSSYVESLRHFGMRAVDSLLRERVAEVVARDFATINIEFRESSPEDFALFSRVDIVGPDPNNRGYYGYDNTHGKDTNNLRLYDVIGGANAVTQEDGYAGYGGVFVNSLMNFSEHPNGVADRIDNFEPTFDHIFDPFREPFGGRRISSADLVDGVPKLTNGDLCPVTDDRSLQISCAVWVLGSLIGTTLSHEIGHSLGLAEPYGDRTTFHNIGDGDNRLMDSGLFRTFFERAELFGQGPSRFCDTEYQYLRFILPTAEPDDPTPRPSCMGGF